MPRNMSFALTTEQVLHRTKDVTRRVGWQFLKPGDVVRGVRKAMGLRKGEKIQPLCLIRIVDVSREQLCNIDREEVAREGFPGMDPSEFCRRFFPSVSPFDYVTRIEFEYIDSAKLGQVKPRADKGMI